MSGDSTGRNPCAEAFTLYFPGLRFGTEYTPLAFVGAVIFVPVSTLRTTTEAPGMGAEVASLAMPVIVPSGDWAIEGRIENAIKTEKTRTARITTTIVWCQRPDAALMQRSPTRRM